jgi:S-adenosyl-L-methionine hydrolase (adenosine-forming)
VGSRVVTLLTDFGTADGYVGEMKGVLVALAPHATLVDIAHDVRAHDVDGARLALERYWLRFPTGTVHVVVVDPGVGSSRAAIAVESEGRYLVGPDNGVLSPALASGNARAVVLPIPAVAAPTFHGRDVFAPAAARLAAGAGLSELGTPASPRIAASPQAQRTADGWRGEVIAIDRFGNAITSLPAGPSRIEVAGRSLPVQRTYSDLVPGQAGAVVGSSGRIEVVVREGRAAEELGLERGAAVIARS